MLSSVAGLWLHFKVQAQAITGLCTKHFSRLSRRVISDN